MKKALKRGLRFAAVLMTMSIILSTTFMVSAKDWDTEDPGGFPGYFGELPEVELDIILKKLNVFVVETKEGVPLTIHVTSEAFSTAEVLFIGSLSSDLKIIDYNIDYNDVYNAIYNAIYNAKSSANEILPECNNGTVTIPDKVISPYTNYEYDVTSIRNKAFSYCTNLTSVEIPETVINIGECAFGCCTSLKSVKIPNSVTSIGEYAFFDCASLESVKIPNSVTSIGEYVFSDCTSLTSVEIPSSVTNIGNRAFYNCKSLTSVEIPSSVTNIGEYAFSYCTSLASVEIPSSVTNIGEYAFSYCTSLKSVEIPSSVESPSSLTKIGNGAFGCCTSLTFVEIPNSVTSIGEYVFYGCSSLSNVISHIKNPFFIASNVFEGCSSELKIWIPVGTLNDYVNNNWPKDNLKIPVIM